MNIIAIRGATTINNNTKEDILQRTEELLNCIIEENNIKRSQIISITFTATKDITKVYPAVAARNLRITQAALMCMQEMYVEGSLDKCIRVMLLATIENEVNINHVYLHGAKVLRPDLAKKATIAIDGPAGAGKSTIAKEVANKLGYIYIDTGAMYRAVAYNCIQNDVNLENESEVVDTLENIDISIKYDESWQRIYIGKNDISDFIRTQEVATGASIVAAYENVRKKLVEIQQNLALKDSVVMDGRDIGTHVLPNANLKIFLTASASERANRRVEELRTKGIDADFEEVKSEIMIRDHSDMNRQFSPLVKADDAIELDTTNKSIEDVTQEIFTLIKDL